jgi:hypothetical protein
MYNNSGLFIVQLEDDEFGALAKLEHLECFGARGINCNTRARLETSVEAKDV